MVALMVPAVALAQEVTPDEVQLDTVLVSSASGKATSIQDAPASITVIGADEIAASGARDLKDVLRTVPGLNTTSGNNGEKSISFRGMPSSKTLILVDGRRMNSGMVMSRHYRGDLGVIPPDAIERIEVVRGPMSTLYGSDAMGGVVNIITKKSYDVWSGSVSTEVAAGDDPTTGDSRSLSGFVTGPLAQNLTLSAWAKFSEIDSPKADTSNTIANNGTRARTLGTRLNWQAHDGLSFGAEFGHTVETYNKTAANGGGPDRDVTRKSVVLNNSWRLGSGQLESTLSFEKSSQVPAGSPADKVSYDVVNFESRYSDATSIAGRDLDYTLGASLSGSKLYDPVTSTDNLITGKANTAALYAEGRLRFNDALTLTGGLRVDHHDRFGTHVTPRLYANYDLGGGMMLKAGYSQAFVAPDLRNLSPDFQMPSKSTGCKPYTGPCNVIGNPNLQPETSDNFEIGVNFQGERSSWEVTAFYNNVSNMIGARKTTEVGSDGRAIFMRDNLDYGKTAGIEAGFSRSMSDALTWSGTATWIGKSEFKYGEFPVPYPMATTPEWNISSTLSWQASGRLKLNGTVNYIGRQAGYVIESDIPPVGGGEPAVPSGQNSKAYTMVNLSASYDLTDKTMLHVGIDNLFNGQPNLADDYRENGRLFRVGLTTRF